MSQSMMYITCNTAGETCNTARYHGSGNNFWTKLNSQTALSGYLDRYSKTCIKRPLSKRAKIGFQDKLSLNAGQKYCRMLQEEHSAILSTFIKLPFVIKIFLLSIFWVAVLQRFYCTRMFWWFTTVFFSVHRLEVLNCAILLLQRTALS